VKEWENKKTEREKKKEKNRRHTGREKDKQRDIVFIT
jgi:hypothetical protein